MKKKIAFLISSLSLVGLMFFNGQFAINEGISNNITLNSIIVQAFAGGGETYIPESCTSSTWCLMHYTDEVDSQGRTYCCSQFVQNEQGKAKA